MLARLSEGLLARDVLILVHHKEVILRVGEILRLDDAFLRLNRAEPVDDVVSVSELLRGLLVNACPLRRGLLGMPRFGGELGQLHNCNK